MITSGRLQECDKPREVLLPVPFDAIDSITEWIDKIHPRLRMKRDLGI